MKNPFISQKLAKKFNLISFETTQRSDNGVILSRPFVIVWLNYGSPSHVPYYYSLATFKFRTSLPDSTLCRWRDRGLIFGIEIKQMY